MPENGSGGRELLDGRYELLERLGAGGMGEVWRARDTRLGREVAVKVFAPPPDTGADDHAELLARFDREARAVATLDSPHIVALHDHGTTTVRGIAGTPYQVMTLVRGRTLEQVLRAEGRVPWRRALRWTEQVCRALAVAHAAGVVHRDIKPANVMVADEDGGDEESGGRGVVKVLDFGIARLAEATEQRLTRTGSLPFGSVLYMAPERFRDAGGDARTDLYALGCVLYELLVGRPPYTGSSAQVMYNHLHDTPLRPSRAVPGLPAAVDRLVSALMARDPADRPQSATKAAEAVRAALAGGGGPAEPGEPVTGEAPGRGPATTTGHATAGPEAAVEKPGLDAPAEQAGQSGAAAGEPAASTPPAASAGRSPAPARRTGPAAQHRSPAGPPTQPAPRPARRRRPRVSGAAVAAAGFGFLLVGAIAAGVVSLDERYPAETQPPSPPAPVSSSAPSAEFDGEYRIGALGDGPTSTTTEDRILSETLARAFTTHESGPGTELTGIKDLTLHRTNQDDDPDNNRLIARWLELEPGLTGVIGGDEILYLPESGLTSFRLPVVRACRHDDSPLTPEPRYAETNELRSSASTADMGVVLARYLAAQEGVRKVYVRGVTDANPTQAVIDRLRVLDIEVRTEHVGQLAEKAQTGVLTDGIREFRPDAVFLEGGTRHTRAWLKAVEGTGFAGVKTVWDPTAPSCTGLNVYADGDFEVPPGWLSVRGYYDIGIDPDGQRRAAVRRALGEDLAERPYAVETYDAARAMLSAWDTVPEEDRRSAEPDMARAALAEALPRVRTKGVLGGGWTRLADAEKHPVVWLDRWTDDGRRQVAELRR